MSNAFLASAKRSMDRHGQNVQYVSVTEGQYNVETGSTTNTETNYTVKMYKKHIRANQYNFPSMIEKDSALFYLVNINLSFLPAPKDKITIGAATYTVDSITEHSADGVVILYKLLAVKG
jgi:hypothetical protein